MTVKPISPKDASLKKLEAIPEAVIEAFNELIVENMDGNGTATVKQDEVVSRVCSKMSVNKDVIFKKGWLDVESLYRKQGWKVNYDKPAYCETYEAFFEFSRR